MPPKAIESAPHLPTPSEAKRALTVELRRDAAILVGIIAPLWVILGANAVFFGGQLVRFGIVPRTVAGLRGILFAPVLHLNMPHLFGNTVGLILLGGMVLLREESDFWIVTGIGAGLGGLGTWLFGRTTVHVGASGVLFAYLGYLLFTGFFERRIGSILLSLGAAFLWGGFVWGILPGQPAISWESHLFGFLAGILAARLLSRHGKRRPVAA
jgi:membrane associated rhomboid family serine protease